MKAMSARLAVITGACTGTGFELARLCAKQRYHLIIAADEPLIEDAALELATTGVSCTPVLCNLATADGVQQLLRTIRAAARPVDALLVNTVHGLGRAFLDQDLDEAMRVIHANIDGTVRLVYAVAKGMRYRGMGRILITGSVAGLEPCTSQAAYNGSKAFLDSFSAALANEMKDSGVTVTCLMPRATETDFLGRARIAGITVESSEKAHAADIARTGFEAMLKGELKAVTRTPDKPATHTTCVAEF